MKTVHFINNFINHFYKMRQKNVARAHINNIDEAMVEYCFYL